ncbi:exosortase [bacterium]|nr:exosortase [bacterium]
MEPIGKISAETWGLWCSLPNKWFFALLSASWVALFHFYGNNTFGYHDTSSMFGWTRYAYSMSADDHYCLFIPFVVVALLIWKRNELIGISKSVWGPALLIFLIGVGMHIVGYLVQQVRISLLGFVVGLYGIGGVTFGKEWTKRTFFPMGLLVFMVPLGTLQDVLTLPLRIVVTKIAVSLGNLFLGLGYLANGSQILSPQGTPLFDVAPACSGIRSLVSMLVLAIIYAYTHFTEAWKRSTLIGLAFPLAILGNLTRITLVLIVGRSISIEAGAMVEQKLGFLTFAIALGGLLFVGKKIRESPPIITRASVRNGQA